MIKKKSTRIVYDDRYNPIVEYYQKIVDGEEIVGEKIRKIYEKLIYDLYDDNNEYEYNSRKANHVIEFIENYCKHSKGKWGGKPVILELWQKALLAASFGFVHKIDGTRKYREVFLVVGRKNGKSTLSSGVGLYLQVADGEPGAEIYAVATKKDQAKIVWSEAKRMVKKSPSLLKRIKPLVSELISDFNDSIFKPLGSDSDTLDGLNVHGALMDEIHAWKDQNLYDVVVDGCSSRDNPMIFIISTAGTVRESVYDNKYEEAEMLINALFQEDGYDDPHFLPLIYELDKKSEWQDEKSWKKANPGLGTIKKVDMLRTKVNKALANNKLVKNLCCKDFNIRETAGETWLTFDELNNELTFDISILKPTYGIGGADLSKTTDLTAAKVIFMLPNDLNIYVVSMYWLPEDLLNDREADDKIPYKLWLEKGLLRTTPGNTVHPKYVTQWFLEVQNELGIYIPWIGYDGWSADYWVEEMRNCFGKESMEKVIQGKYTLSGPMQRLEADIKKKYVIYNNNPIDKWCLSNTSVDVDKNGNIQPIKVRSRKRIDGTAALLNAYVALERHKNDYMNMI